MAPGRSDVQAGAPARIGSARSWLVESLRRQKIAQQVSKGEALLQSNSLLREGSAQHSKWSGRQEDAPELQGRSGGGAVLQERLRQG